MHLFVYILFPPAPGVRMTVIFTLRATVFETLFWGEHLTSCQSTIYTIDVVHIHVYPSYTPIFLSIFT